MVLLHTFNVSRSCAYVTGLAACSLKAFGVCSKAFIKLESIDTLTPKQRHQYEALAVEIFAKYANPLYSVALLVWLLHGSGYCDVVTIKSLITHRCTHVL